MQPLLSLALTLASTLAWAVEPAPLAAAEALVAAINNSRTANHPGEFEALLAKDLPESERAAILRSEEALCEEARRPLSEVMVPHLTIRAVRLITPDVAEVQAINVQAAAIPGSSDFVSTVLVLKKEGDSVLYPFSRWRIASLRNQFPTR